MVSVTSIGQENKKIPKELKLLFGLAVISCCTMSFGYAGLMKPFNGSVGLDTITQNANLTMNKNQDLDNSSNNLQSLDSSETDSEGRLSIITAFSNNHQLETVAMIRTLVAVNFHGPLHIYIMRHVGDNPNWSENFKKEISQVPLQIQMIDLEVLEEYETYCFKTKAMAHFIHHNGLKPENERAQVVMWTDSSTRFMQNPLKWARHMISDGVDFVARITVWNLPAQTHQSTFLYYKLNPSDFKNDTALAATHFLVNLLTEPKHQILTKWIDCGTMACQTCMAPLGSSKREPNANKNFQPGQLRYISHRQDQAVLSLLVYNYTKYTPAAKTQIGDMDKSTKYFCVRTNRGLGGPIGSVKKLSDWRPGKEMIDGGCIDE